MSDHSSSVFNNACLTLPRNPKSRQPLAVYEQKYLNQLQNEVTKLDLQAPKDTNMKTPKDNYRIKSFIEFVGSIPEYDEVNHLSNKDFYKKIELLKEKQKSYSDYLHTTSKLEDNRPEWLEDYKNYVKNSTEESKKKSTIKPFCVTPILSKSPKYAKSPDVESVTLSDNTLLKPPSRRSVRIIETPSPGDTPELFRRPKSRLPSASSKGQEEWDNFTIDDYKLDLDEISPGARQSKSVPNSPTKSKPSVGWKDSGITIPQPFEMTIRDEEDQIVEELLIQTIKPKEEKPEMFKAHTVPIESQIPLFDTIMAEQELKNQMVRERSKARLQAQMRPFSFTERDEEIQNLNKILSKSSPSLFLDDPPIKIKKFKAKPVPKSLFSNYVYKKMHEDEFYRALQKRIRAEEMLRSSSLPPSMAKREQTHDKYDVCPRSYRDVLGETPKTRRNPYRFTSEEYEKELEDLKNEFLGPAPNQRKTKRSAKKTKKFRNVSASSTDSRTPSSLEVQAINRSNLAAVLRIQSARKRLEREMCQKLEDAKLKEECRWREKLMRKKPVWHALAYSNEEDLAMRLQLRRDEEKLRGEEHKLRMQLMLGRVHRQPTLFERQSQVLQYPKSREELLDNLYSEYKNRKNAKRSLSDLSDAKMKDAQVQALLDEQLQETDSTNSKDSIQEKCESLSSASN